MKVLLLLLLLVSPSFGLEFEWEQFTFGPGVDSTTALAADENGVTITGHFEGTSFGLASQGYSDVMVVRFSLDGKMLWKKSFGGAAPDKGTDVTTDSRGNIIVTGFYAGILDVDGKKLTSNGVNDIFVVSISPVGRINWIRSFGGPLNDHTSFVAAGAEVFVTGHFQDNMQCGDQSIVSAGGIDIFLAKLSLTGNVEWCRAIGGFRDQEVAAIALDSLQVYIGGSTDNLAGTPFEAFVASYKITDGTDYWSKFFGSSGYDSVLALDTRNGQLVAGGYFGLFGSRMDLCGKTLPQFGNADAFLAVFSNMGECIKASSMGGSNNDYLRALSIAPNNDVFFTGDFQGITQIGSILKSVGQSDIFLAQTRNIEVLESYRFGSFVNDKGLDIVATHGGLFLAGFAIYQIDFKRPPTNLGGSSDGFLVKFKEVWTPTPLPTSTFTYVPNTPRPVPTGTSTHTPIPADCPGDCNGDGSLSMVEKQACVSIYFSSKPLDFCSKCDINSSGVVEVSEVVSIIMQSCP